MLHAPFSKILGMAAVAGGTLLAMPTAAQNFEVKGQLNVQIELVEACLIDSEEPTSGATDLDFGTLDFGEHTTFFEDANAVATGPTSGALTIKCTPGIVPKLSFDGGQNAGSGAGIGPRAMRMGSNFVTYDLFHGGDPILIDEDVELLDTGDNLTISISGVAHGEAGLRAGVYQDVVTVTLTL